MTPNHRYRSPQLGEATHLELDDCFGTTPEDQPTAVADPIGAFASFPTARRARTAPR